MTTGPRFGGGGHGRSDPETLPGSATSCHLVPPVGGISPPPPAFGQPQSTLGGAPGPTRSLWPVSMVQPGGQGLGCPRPVHACVTAAHSPGGRRGGSGELDVSSAAFDLSDGGVTPGI